MVEHRTGTLATQVRFPSAARELSPRVNFQCRLSYGVRTPPCAIACIYTCAHVKDPVVYVRVRWIMKTLKHPASTVGWVARLCRSWLSTGKATRISHRRKSIGTIQLKKVIRKSDKVTKAQDQLTHDVIHTNSLYGHDGWFACLRVTTTTTHTKQDKASFCTAVRQMLISWYYQTKKIY